MSTKHGPRTDPCVTPWRIVEEEEVIPSIIVILFLSLYIYKIWFQTFTWDSSNSVRIKFCDLVSNAFLKSKNTDMTKLP